MKKKLVVYLGLLGILISSTFVLNKQAKALEVKIEEHHTEDHDDDLNIIAHRGFSCLYPDNTLSSIEACNTINCIDGIEVDVRLTKDDQLLLFHESSVNFFGVSGYTYEELTNVKIDNYIKNKRFYRGYTMQEAAVLESRYDFLMEEPASLCTLEEALKVRDKDKLFFVDLKFSGYHDDVLISKVASLLHNEDNIVIQSFNEEMLKVMQEAYPEYKYQLLIDRSYQLDSIDYSFDGYGIKHTILGEDTIQDLIDHDKMVSIWTVDSYKEFAKLHNKYSDYDDDIYYISDNPDMICYQYIKKG